MKETIIGAVAVIAFVLSVVGLQQIAHLPVVTNTPQYGATPGGDFNYPCETHNGIQRCFVRYALSTASTTSCVIKSPVATSTLVLASAVVTGNQAAESINFTKGNSMQASTTALSSTFAIAAAGRFSGIASTTNPEDTRTFNPNTWLQINIFGGSGVASSTGTCQATFEIQ